MKPNYKIILLIWIIFEFEFMTERDRYDHYFNHDLYVCPTCFLRTEQHCRRFIKTIETGTESTLMRQLMSFVSFGLGKRETRILRLSNTEHKVIAKALARSSQYDLIANKSLTRQLLENMFTDSVQVQDLQFCPLRSIHQFVDYMETQNDSDELTAWLYMLINVQPILNPFLHRNGFPVPKTLATCGFTTFQEYVGQPMHEFYSASFGLKLRIAIQLLEGVIKFSNGFHGFRLHITDLTADNVVYNVEQNKLYFIDLDSLLIVNAANVSKRKELGSVHKYTYIPCNNCFAYVQRDICEKQNSDFVIFQACQLLREDLMGNYIKGFLYPVPRYIKKTYRKWNHFINMCVDCPLNGSKCKNRFKAAADLIGLFKLAIHELGL